MYTIFHSTLFWFFLISHNSEVVSQPDPRPPLVQSKVQVAVLLDASGSMDGLLHQAKSRLWQIVNEVSSFEKNGVRPQVEFALYTYGKDTHPMEDGYVKCLLPFTSSLDDLSEKLFAVSTNGGSEFCGKVIQDGHQELAWSKAPDDLRVIYIAGNEPFDQGEWDYKNACGNAYANGIFINTIYCGNYNEGVRTHWKNGATIAGGDYFNIDHDKRLVERATPWDEKINQYNDSLNQTYLGYGNAGREYKQKQMLQDSNAENLSMQAKTERSVAKSKAVYKNDSWDLIDAVENNKVNLEELSDDALPEAFKGLSDQEKEEKLAKLKVQRNNFQKEIEVLAVKRAEYLRNEQANQSDEDDFGKAIVESISKQAKIKGFEKAVQ